LIAGKKQGKYKKIEDESSTDVKNDDTKQNFVKFEQPPCKRLSFLEFNTLGNNFCESREILWLIAFRKKEIGKI